MSAPTTGREIHGTYWKIRHRVTGLFMADLEGKVWSHRGRLFKTKASLHRYLRWLPEIPREWLLVPIELVVRDDRTVRADVYIDVWKKSLKGKKKKRKWGL